MVINKQEVINHLKETEIASISSKSDTEHDEGCAINIDLLYVRFEEQFIKNRIFLIILFAVSAVLSFTVYALQNYEGLAPILGPIMMVLGWGFYVVTTEAIGSKSNMRNIRKIQKTLELSNENTVTKEMCEQADLPTH